MSGAWCCGGNAVDRGQGKACECSRRQSCAAMGIDWSEPDPMESTMARLVAAFLLACVLAVTADRWLPVLLEFFL